MKIRSLFRKKWKKKRGVKREGIREGENDDRDESNVEI